MTQTSVPGIASAEDAQLDSARQMIAALMRTVFAQEIEKNRHRQWRVGADQDLPLDLPTRLPEDPFL